MGAIWIITSPRRAFDYIREKKSFLVPFVIVCVVNILFFLVISPIQSELMQDELSSEGVQMPPGVMRMVGVVGIPVGVVIGWLIYALIIWVLMAAAGGKWDYRTAFSLVGHVGIIGSIQKLLSIPVVWMKRDAIASLTDLHPSFGPAIFYTGDNMKILSFLRGLDIFSIWAIVLLILGAAHLSGVKKRVSAWLIGSLYVLVLIIQALFAGLRILGQG